jgi:hypothetical protein
MAAAVIDPARGRGNQGTVGHGGGHGYGVDLTDTCATRNAQGEQQYSDDFHRNTQVVLKALLGVILRRECHDLVDQNGKRYQ